MVRDNFREDHYNIQVLKSKVRFYKCTCGISSISKAGSGIVDLKYHSIELKEVMKSSERDVATIPRSDISFRVARCSSSIKKMVGYIMCQYILIYERRCTILGRSLHLTADSKSKNEISHFSLGRVP